MGNCLFLRRGAPPSSGPPKRKTLDEYTWEEISYISSNGLAGEYGFQVGDAKAITLNGTIGALTLDNYLTYAFIIGINHNAELEGNNLIHFQVGKTALSGGVDICLYEDSGFEINENRINTGGWAASNMRNNICGTNLADYPTTSFLAAVSNDLRAVLKPVIKYTDNVGGVSNTSHTIPSASAVTATTEFCFLASEYEVFATTGGPDGSYVKGGNPYEANYQQQYQYFINAANTIKKQHKNLTMYAYWWTRTPYYRAYYNDMWQIASASRKINHIDTNYSRGFSPCFCV